MVIVFLMLPIYMNYLTASEYGLIQTINALVSVISIFYLTSLRTSITRSYIDYENDSEKQGLILTVFTFLMAFALLLSGLLMLLKGVIAPSLFNNIPVDPYFRYMVLLSLLTVFPIIPLSVLRIKEQPFKFVMFNLLETILIVLLTVYLLIIKDMGAIGSLQALIFARTIMAFIYVIFIINFTKMKIRAMHWHYIASSLALALPLIPHFLASWVNNASDRVIIEQFSSLNALGIYALGAQFNMGFLMLLNSFNMAYNPRFYKMMKKDEMDQKTYSKIFRIVVMVASIFSFAGLIAIPLFVQYLGEASYQSDYLFVWLLFGGTLWHLGYMLSVSSLIYYKKMGRVAFITVATAVINIGINLALIPVIGIFGAAIATYVAYFFEFYYVKRLADKHTKEVFKVEPQILYVIQALLIINLLIISVIDNYYLLVGSIIGMCIYLFKKHKESLMQVIPKKHKQKG